MTHAEIKEIIKTIMKQEEQKGYFPNGNSTTYKRYYEDDNEYTLVDNKLYLGVAYFDGEKSTYSTVTRLKEGRGDDTLSINGYRPKFASLIANNIVNENDFHKTC